MAQRLLPLVVLLSCSLVACVQVPIATLIVQGNDAKALAQINESIAPPRNDPGYRKALPEAVWAGKTEITQALILHGAELDVHTGDLQLTPLHYAVHWKTIEIREDDTRVLLESRADPNQLSKEGESPLHFIVFRDVDPTQTDTKERVIRMLLDHGGNAAQRSSAGTGSGTTPLFLSAGRGDPNTILQALIDHGADPSGARDDQLTPLDVAVGNDHTEAARFLLDHGAMPHVLLEGATWQAEDLVVYNQFRTSGKSFALFGEWKLERGENEIAREAFQTAEGQLVLAATEYRRHAEVAGNAVGAARAGDVGRAAGSLLLTTVGVATAVVTGIGFVSRPVFTDNAAELETQSAESLRKAEECERLALEMRAKVAALPEPSLLVDPGARPEGMTSEAP